MIGEARESVEAGLPVDLHLVVTDAGVEKAPEQPRILADATRVSEAVARQVAELNRS